jgi:C4-dicarboxylate transporter DctM subunit
MFMEGGAAIIILAPVLSRVATSVGIHPLHFGFVEIGVLILVSYTPWAILIIPGVLGCL